MKLSKQTARKPRSATYKGNVSAGFEAFAECQAHRTAVDIEADRVR